MNKAYLTVASDGKVISGHIIDGPEEIPPNTIPCAPDIIHLIGLGAGLIYWDGGKLCFPQEDRKICNALMSRGSMSGREIFSELRGFREVRGKINSDIPVGTGINHSPFFLRKGFMPEHEFPEAPGLKIRNFNYAFDMEKVVEELKRVGIYEPSCPDSTCNCNPPSDHPWIMTTFRIGEPQSWDLILEYEGEPLQFETVSRSQEATISLTIHFNKERSHWFWREAEKPVFDRLKLKYPSVLFRPVKTRPDWKDTLIKNYKAIYLGEMDKTYVLQTDISQIAFDGWPERKTLGTDWKKQEGSIVIREGTSLDVLEIDTFINEVWSDHPRKSLIQNTFKHYWNLDRASILMAYNDGKLIDVQLIRKRKNIQSGIAFLSNRSEIDSTKKDTIMEEIYAWQRQVGYKETSFFLDKSLIGHPAVQRDIRERKYELIDHTQFRRGMVEFRLRLGA